jgi:hypothetical protein
MEGYLKYFREHREGYIVGAVMLALLLWSEHAHTERMNGIIACAMQSYEDVNDSIRLGFAQLAEHQTYLEDLYNECVSDLTYSATLQE